ncbi:MAG: HAD-IC family P-type ATPase [Acidimicrobiia bacterium]|nr:HAD-IC family P-type ATPase [Acidimicrobiia bacterium]
MSITADPRADAADDDGTQWCALEAGAAAAALGVEPTQGLSAGEVVERRDRFGSNRLAEPPVRPKWLVFVDQFRTGIVYLLGGAGLLAGILGDIKDLVVIFLVLIANAVLGYVQQSKASNALAALERMLVTRVRVRRDGVTDEVDIDELVPGDVVLLEAGDRVPADGRLVLTANTSIDESSLTGESVPVDKHADADVAADAAIGDRINMAWMNTTVVRGRAEMVVTATGMRTEIGRVADLLASAETSKTPLEKQLDHLSHRLAIIAGVAAVVVFITQWFIEGSFRDAMLGAVALAVAAIPEGLPAVVTVTLAVGIAQMAKENAIVKRLHSVETLGSTSVICSDKTGTLTMNQMTMRELDCGGVTWRAEGEGYAPVGRIVAEDGSDRTAEARGPLLVAALCSDAVLIDDGGAPGIIGDPTEAALVVAAAKVGLVAPDERGRRPRLGEVPFDSATKFMATFHRVDPDDRGSDVMVCVKGAPDVLLARSTTRRLADGSIAPIDTTARDSLQASNHALAAHGLRVLALASRTLPASEVLGPDGTVTDPDTWVDGLCLEALAGIVDPPRSEARDAIAVCRQAGIDVKMITGDHGVTAGAIAAQLGIRGEVVTGDDLDAMDDAELAARVADIGVCARVAPEHKVRVVEALRSHGSIVAMTGDGVNDAAALRRSDIGVAMGITGTEVTKEAGDMVLTDDNFATIVVAVRRGRTVYDNILKFIRFQLATSFGAISTIFGASLIGQPVPFTPLQVLWVNLIADGPTAIALGLDAPSTGVMDRSPVPAGARILDRARFLRIAFQGVVTGVGVLALYAWAIGHYGESAENKPIVAMTLAFTAFVLAQVVNVFSARSETRSVFSRDTLTNGRLWASVIGVVVLQIVITEFGPARDLFDTAALSFGQWMLCLLPPAALLVAVEGWKAGARRRRRRPVEAV